MPNVQRIQPAIAYRKNDHDPVNSLMSRDPYADAGHDEDSE